MHRGHRKTAPLTKYKKCGIIYKYSMDGGVESRHTQQYPEIHEGKTEAYKSIE